MAYLGELIKDLGGRFKDVDVTTEPNKSKAIRYINRAARWIYTAHPWDWRQKMGQITLIPNYTTGTCAVTGFDGTNEGDARTVIFSGSTLAANMQGRFIQVDGDDSWHRIVNVDVSGNKVYLDSEITRTTAVGLTFKIWKRFYYLPGDVAQITDFGRWANRLGRMEYKSFSKLTDEVADVSDDGTPEDFTPFGVDNFEPVYTVGSISGSTDSNVLTGSGSEEWLANIMPGDLIVQGENTFTVKRVETNARMVLSNYLPTAIDTQTYEARRNLSVGFQFYPAQMNNYFAIPYYYYDRIFNMMHEAKDRPNLPDEFDDAILSRAEFKWRKDQGDSQWLSVAQLFSAELQGLKSDYRMVKPQFDTFGPEVRGYPGR